MIAPSRIARLEGFGRARHADAYVFRPTRREEIAEVFTLNRPVVLRGAGRSYGDASVAPEAVAIDLSRMNRILAWDPETGILEAEGGVTIEGVWRTTLQDGWWPPVVSGTMFPTLAGALSMNIHGKNAFRVGPIGEHVLEFDLLTPQGQLLTLTPADPRFFGVIGGLGLLGAITRVKLQMKRVHSGDLRVLPLSQPHWAAQFETMERFAAEADYLVSWVDLFGQGRGLIHAAWYTEEADPRPASLRAEHQDLPDTLLGFIPKSMMWRFMKPFTNPTGMRLINAAKYQAGRRKGDGIPHAQSLVGFSFLLDYVPNWRLAYGKKGFHQVQIFVPSLVAPTVLPRVEALQREAGLTSYLGVLKRHRSDAFWLSHAVDGYSLAMDFPEHPRLAALAERITQLVLDHGGRFYFAKDSHLSASAARTFLGDEAWTKFQGLRDELDPNRVLTSALAVRLGL